MDRILRRVVQEACVYTGVAQSLLTGLEHQFEALARYDKLLNPVSSLYDRLGSYYVNEYFCLKTYTPVRVDLPEHLIDGMDCIGVNLVYSEDAQPGIGGDVLDEMGPWVVLTIIQDKHPLKGLVYASNYIDGELRCSVFDPATFDEQADVELIQGGLGTFYDPSDIVLRYCNPKMFKPCQGAFPK